MRKKDRLFLTPLLLSGLLLTAAPGLKLPAMASESESETLMETEQFVFDKADLLTDAEEEELNEKANDLAGTFHMNFVILTTDDAEKRHKPMQMISTWTTVSMMMEKMAEPSILSIWITAGFR